MKKYILKLLILLKVFSNTFLQAHFEDVPISARVAGLNNTAVAVGDDVFTSYLNPAGLANIGKLELGVDYNKLHLGLTDGSDISSSMILISKKFEKIGGFLVGFRQFGLTNYYVERKYTLGYARNMAVLNKPLSLGFKVNVLSKLFGKTAYTENAVNLLTSEVKNGMDPVFAKGYSKLGIGLDFGIIYNYLSKHYFGVLFENLNQPDMGLATKDVVPLIFKLGHAFVYYGFKVVSDVSVSKLGSLFSFAGEREIDIFELDKIMLRGGLGFGSRDYINLSVGASYVYKHIFRFDYSFSYLLSGITKTYGSHQISLILKFN